MKKKIIPFLLFTALLTTACGRLKDSDISNNATTTNQKAKSYQTTATGNDGYSVLLKNGKYLTSPIAGLSGTTNAGSTDDRELERGLIDISKKIYSPNSFVFQEGQYISETTGSDWLGRYSKSNSTGLNPENKGKTHRPRYLEQIVEQDYLTGSGQNYSIAGMSIGLGMNSTDYYQKTSGGPTYTASISKSDQRKYGEEYANIIVKRLRQKKALKNIPITVALYSKASEDSLTSGAYFAYGTADKNSSKITKWKRVSVKWQVLPTVGSAKAYNSQDSANFVNFKGAIQNYFPNISGVIGYLRYQDGKLAQENITITTQFYGYEQVQSFARLVLNTAKKYLSNDVPIEIQISSVNDVQAVVFKESSDSSYQLHIYGGE
ncbi:MAG: CamS family sex pheromone protein [Lactobacillus sp.]|nr:CamS family sex pheromone protein [Lactobacillus sp.]